VMICTLLFVAQGAWTSYGKETIIIIVLFEAQGAGTYERKRLNFVYYIFFVCDFQSSERKDAQQLNHLCIRLLSLDIYF